MVNVKENYISEDEERELLSYLRPMKRRDVVARNSVKRYGSKLPYISRVNPVIPPYFQPILSRLDEDGIILSDSVTVNEYHPGQSIDWHIDSPESGPTIVVLSLESDAVMGLKNSKEDILRILPRRSLLVMDGDERYIWEHCIYPLAGHRFSIVFRRGTNASNSSKS